MTEYLEIKQLHNLNRILYEHNKELREEVCFLKRRLEKRSLIDDILYEKERERLEQV